MNTAILSLLLLWLPGAQVNEAHDFHVSKCLMEYDPEEQSLQMSMHIFLDDLELALSKRGQEQLFLCTPRETAEAEAQVEAYLRDHFKLTINGELRTFKYWGKEISDDLSAVWCYLEVDNLQEINELELTYRILFDTYGDQKNLASLTLPGQEPGMLFFQVGDETKGI
jgi:myo-inositol catabolism protein IolC